ncbi:MAG TPA: hypothetical protein VNI01_11740 [Elusimicrobiota bacterium]|nr:hypothetical protein [Elusimicrobiota bacterium]
MSCLSWEEVCDSLHGEGGASFLERARAHLSGCAACSAEAGSAERTRLRAELLPVPPMPRELRAALVAMAREADAARRPGWRERLAAAGLAPAALAAAAAAAALFLGARGPAPLEAKIEVPLDLLIAAHQQYARTLPLSAPDELETRMPDQLAGATGERDVF